MAKRRPAGPPRDDGLPRVHAWSIRTPAGPTALRLALLCLLAWMGSMPLFIWFIPGVAERVAQLGFGGFALGWLAMSAIICLGYALGYLVLRRFAPGDRKYSERAVLGLALGDSFAAAVGGFGLGFLPLSIGPDPFTAFTWTIAVGMLFGTAQLMPGYLANWREAEGSGQAR